MKKLIVLLALALFSCKKEEPKPECECSEVLSYKIGGGLWVVQSTTPTNAQCWRHNELLSEWHTIDPENIMPHFYKKQIICE